ncbi:hypothetical protein GN956_G14327 [Arapaima gigas]
MQKKNSAEPDVVGARKLLNLLRRLSVRRRSAPSVPFGRRGSGSSVHQPRRTFNLLQLLLRNFSLWFFFSSALRLF